MVLNHKKDLRWNLILLLLVAETPGVLRVVKDQVHTLHPVTRGVGGSGPRVTKVGGNVISSLGGVGNLH